MKGALYAAGAALLGCSAAEVHKLALKKVPLAEQLVRRNHRRAMSNMMLTIPPGDRPTSDSDGALEAEVHRRPARGTC